MAKIKSNRINPRLINLTGHKYGKLTVLGRGPNISLSCGCNLIAAGRRRVIDMTDQRFGKLTAIALTGSNSERKALWQCACDCGNTAIVTGKALRSGGTTSCGCGRMARLGDINRTHGMTGTSEHRSWKHAKERCVNPKNKSYTNYGGRGITMCPEWMNSFELFYAHIGPRPPRLTLDRIDNEKGYEPGNVRWATGHQQRMNQRRMYKP